MPITQRQLDLLSGYRDKAYVYVQLLTQSHEYYNLIKNILSIPIIISSSVMSIMNSLFQESSTELKYANIIINASTVFLISMTNNIKVNEKITNFKQIEMKMTKYLHNLEDQLINNQENLKTDDIRNFTIEYDNIVEQIDYSIPDFIKSRIKKLYLSKRTLPNILNCELSIVLDPQIQRGSENLSRDRSRSPERLERLERIPSGNLV